MKILITGSKGFIGSNLVARLKEEKGHTIYQFTHKSDINLLKNYLKECDFIFHLAGINRGTDSQSYMEGNYGLTKTIKDYLIEFQNPCQFLFSSSIHAVLNNPYGESKKACEELLFDLERKNNNRMYIYRLPNLFGRWGRPNYNSVVATFCYNISHDLPIVIRDRNVVLNMVYIKDLIEEFIQVLNGGGRKNKDGFYEVTKVYQITLGAIADHIYSFKENTSIELNPETFEGKLLETYLNYNNRE